MPIQEWIQANGLIPVQNVLIEVDAACQVEISSLADSECTSQPMGNNIGAVVGYIVGGVAIIALIIVIVTVFGCLFKRRREKLHIQKMTR